MNKFNKNILVFVCVYILTICVVGVIKAQKSLVDLRDSTSTKNAVIIISCDCSCDTTKTTKDSIPYL